tara:strand:+ start:1397 stop:1822 length:426 start_codon:yes stop_codon:yes gene_type:complete
MSWRTDYDGPDYDSLEAHGMAGYYESLADYSDDEDSDDDSDDCEGNGGCYACEQATPSVDFMGQPLCWDCYQAIAKGNHARDTCEFAHPGGNSALRAAGPGNPRVHPCPNCKASNVLTPQDKSRGYQCDSCADRAERGGDY